MESTKGEDPVATTTKNEHTDTALVVVQGDVDADADGGEYALMELYRRRAHICCGCDTRNAILTVDTLAVCWYVVMMVSFSLLLGDNLQYDDDRVQSVMDALDNTTIGLEIARAVVGIVLASIGIVGATLFSRFMTSIGAAWYVFESINCLFFGNFIGAIVAAGFCYPHAVFYEELKTGIMSRENYPKEKICCDCCCSW